MTAFPPLPLAAPAASLPPIERAALLLDLDGTLLDLAPAPDLVVVPEGLPEALLGLRTRLGDALGVISGRPVEQVDALFPDIPFAVAGEHGGALRRAPGAPIERLPLPELPARWIAAAERLAEARPGVLLERKRRGFTLHYRAVPQHAEALRLAVADLLAGHADRFALLPAHMAWEVRPIGADKGKAVAEIMAREPFAGRRPVFIGDDVTDEDAIAAAQAVGGIGLRVPEAFGDAAGVRAWLARAARRAM